MMAKLNNRTLNKCLAYGGNIRGLCWGLPVTKWTNSLIPWSELDLMLMQDVIEVDVCLCSLCGPIVACFSDVSHSIVDSARKLTEDKYSLPPFPSPSPPSLYSQHHCPHV